MSIHRLYQLPAQISEWLHHQEYSCFKNRIGKVRLGNTLIPPRKLLHNYDQNHVSINALVIVFREWDESTSHYAPIHDFSAKYHNYIYKSDLIQQGGLLIVQLRVEEHRLLELVLEFGHLFLKFKFLKLSFAQKTGNGKINSCSITQNTHNNKILTFH